MHTICWNKFETTTRNNLQFYWSHPQFTDVTLALEEGKEIKAHKIILCNGSTFFQKLFRNSDDKKYFSIDEIHPNITFKELEIIVKFIYLGQCEMDNSELESIFSVGRDLGIIGLIESQENFVIHFPCNICNYKATEYDSLTIHMKNIHTEISKKVKIGKKKEKIEFARSKVISENLKDVETMAIDEVEEELQTYMEGETDKERSDYYAAARKRARDRLVKAHYRDVKKPGKIDNILIKVDMLKDFRKNGRKPISMKRLQKKKDTIAKMSNKNNIHTESLKSTIPYTQDINDITKDIQKVSTINKSVQEKDDSTQYINENNSAVATLNGETTDPQEVKDKTLQSVNDTTSNRQEVKEVNPNIHIIHDIHSNPQETHNNVQELKYSNIQSQEINDIIPHMQTVDDIVTHTLDINDITSFLDTVNAKNDPSVIFI